MHAERQWVIRSRRSLVLRLTAVSDPAAHRKTEGITVHQELTWCCRPKAVRPTASQASGTPCHHQIRFVTTACILISSRFLSEFRAWTFLQPNYAHGSRPQTLPTLINDNYTPLFPLDAQNVSPCDSLLPPELCKPGAQALGGRRLGLGVGVGNVDELLDRDLHNRHDLALRPELVANVEHEHEDDRKVVAEEVRDVPVAGELFISLFSRREGPG